MNTKFLSWFPKALFIPVMVLLITLNSQTAGAVGVCYVNASVGGANNGASWADAYTDLQSALGGSPCTEVWVATGTYKPTGGTDRMFSFVLKNGVALYGGFIGTESVRTERDPAANVTTLSGDIGITGDVSDNSDHVVSGGGTDGTAMLDGFTITAGRGGFDRMGGGMYNISSSPTLTNLTFNGNWAGFSGGGMSNENSNPTLMNVIFISNTSYYGGGMYNFNSSPTLTNVTFNNNLVWGVTPNGNNGGVGGGMYNDNSSPTLTNVTFSNNTANYIYSGYSLYGHGGGIYNGNSSAPMLTNVTFSSNSAVYGGGMSNENSSPTLTNVTFSSNSAVYGGSGGGMSNENSSPTLTNVTFSGNSASFGGGMFNYYNGNTPQIRNSIFWGDSASIAGAEIYNDTSASIPSLADSVVAVGCPSGATCTNIITTDPQLGPLSNNGGFTQTRALGGAGSSAIDTGNDATCASTDQRGVTRPQGAHCDMGAYEWVDSPYHIYLPLVFR